MAQRIYYVIIDTVYIYLIDCRNPFYLPQLNVMKLLKVARYNSFNSMCTAQREVHGDLVSDPPNLP